MRPGFPPSPESAPSSRPERSLPELLHPLLCEVARLVTLFFSGKTRLLVPSIPPQERPFECISGVKFFFRSESAKHANPFFP